MPVPTAHCIVLHCKLHCIILHLHTVSSACYIMYHSVSISYVCTILYNQIQVKSDCSKEEVAKAESV